MLDKTKSNKRGQFVSERKMYSTELSLLLAKIEKILILANRKLDLLLDCFSFFENAKRCNCIIINMYNVTNSNKFSDQFKCFFIS